MWSPHEWIKRPHKRRQESKPFELRVLEEGLLLSVLHCGRMLGEDSHLLTRKQALT